MYSIRAQWGRKGSLRKFYVLPSSESHQNQWVFLFHLLPFCTFFLGVWGPEAPLFYLYKYLQNKILFNLVYLNNKPKSQIPNFPIWKLFTFHGGIELSYYIWFCFLIAKFHVFFWAKISISFLVLVLLLLELTVSMCWYGMNCFFVNFLYCDL